MSNLLFMDESNGNGVYASKSNNVQTTTTTTPTATMGATAPTSITNTTAITADNINNIMSATAAAAAAAVSATTTTPATLPTSVSSEDLSQSLSEYTDADESISAPTEFLAEFLSAVMLKDYKKALKYCKLILQYEPNNITAKEFYPLILDKLHGATTSSDSDENYNKSSSPEMVLELQGSEPSANESDGAVSDDQQMGMEEDAADEFDCIEDNYLGEPNSQSSNANTSSSSCDVLAGTSLSDDEDDVVDDVDEDEIDDVDNEEVDDIDCDEDEDDEEDVISSSGDDLPIDEQNYIGVDEAIGGGHNSHSSRNSSSGGGGRSRSDNTTHSYSSLLLEEEDDIVPVSLQFSKELSAGDLDVSNGNKLPSAPCSDSESPTEPLTQRLAAILLSKCGVSDTKANN